MSIDQYLTYTLRATLVLLPVTLIAFIGCVCIKKTRKYAVYLALLHICLIALFLQNLTAGLIHDDVTRIGHEKYEGWSVKDFALDNIRTFVVLILLFALINYIFFRQRHIKRRYIIGILAGVLMMLFQYRMITFFFPIDLSQSFRYVQQWNRIRFADYKSDETGVCYKRCVWGLMPTLRTEELPLKWKETVRDETALEYIESVHKYPVDECLFSPDHRYVLFSECYDLSQGASTGPYHCYYRVYDLEREKVHTVYHGKERHYRIGWLP